MMIKIVINRRNKKGEYIPLKQLFSHLWVEIQRVRWLKDSSPRSWEHEKENFKLLQNCLLNSRVASGI